MLKTKRLIVRSLQLDDAERVELLASEYDLAKTTLNVPHPYPEGSAVDFIQHMLRHESKGHVVIFAIIEQKTGQLIGLIDIHINKTHQHGELGYWIGKPYWGQGFGTEAARKMVAFGFQTLHLNKVFALAFLDNPGSWRIMEKIGMSYEGTLRQHYMKFGKYIDVVNYGVLKETFQKHSEQAR